MTKRKCRGYQLDTVFVPYLAKPERKSSRRELPAGSSTNLSLVVTPATCITSPFIPRAKTRQFQQYGISRPFGSLMSEEFTSVILNRFLPVNESNKTSLEPGMSQVCGAWVQILPSLVAGAPPGTLISLATRAFGAAILDVSDLGKSNQFRSNEAYLATLQELKNNILLSKNCLRIETAAAIACLAMTELLLPTSNEATYAHCKGLGALMSSYPPDLFDSDNFHFVFVGCRPVLLFQALVARRSTFLAQNPWLTAPFSNRPPSELQKLISEAAIIPSIMEEIDILPTLSGPAAFSRAVRAQSMLLGVLGQLDEWIGRFGRITIGFPGGFTQSILPDGTRDITSNMRYPNLLTANVHIHLWAFQIICLTELEKIYLFTSSHKSAPDHEAGAQNGSSGRQLGLATNICQSIDYFLQDRMNLHGPAASLFPLGIAYDVFRRDTRKNTQFIRRCQELFDRIYSKGFSKGSGPAAQDDDGHGVQQYSTTDTF